MGYADVGPSPEAAAGFGVIAGLCCLLVITVIIVALVLTRTGRKKTPH